MFVAGKSIPKIGEIRFGYASDDESRLSTHKYVGVHPYLVVSNNTYNKTSGQCEVIPFTTKRIGKYNPVHVEYKAGEVSGLIKDSTLIIEEETRYEIASLANRWASSRKETGSVLWKQ